MEIKKRTNDAFRVAVNHLRAVKKIKVQELADAAGCSKRYVQGVLSEKEKKSPGGDIARQICKAFGYTYEDMLALGRWILDGKNPEEWGKPTGFGIGHYGQTPFGGHQGNTYGLGDRFFNVVIERVKRSIGVETSSQLYELLGVEPSSFVKAKRNNHIPEEWFKTLENNYGLNKAELVAPLKKLRSSLVTSYGAAFQEEEKNYDPHFSAVRKAKPKLSGGNGNLVLEEGWTGLYHFRSDWLNYICTVNNAVLFDVDGDSMSPTINDKETVLIDRSRTEFENDKIFAIGIGDTILVKRLKLKVSGKINVISDNPDKKRFEDEEIDPSEIRILGIVVWRGGTV